MSSKRTAGIASPRWSSALDWQYWLLPIGLMLLTLCQALPAHSAHVETTAGRHAAQVHSADPVLPTSYHSLIQLRRSLEYAPRSNSEADALPDFLFAVVMALSAASACSFLFTNHPHPSLLPVVTQPGAPRGPPVRP